MLKPLSLSIQSQLKKGSALFEPIAIDQIDNLVILPAW